MYNSIATYFKIDDKKVEHWEQISAWRLLWGEREAELSIKKGYQQ